MDSSDARRGMGARQRSRLTGFAAAFVARGQYWFADAKLHERARLELVAQRADGCSWIAERIII